MTLAALDAATLLGRSDRGDAAAAAAEHLRGARVLITGAGGSIGSALSRALAGRVESLILLDHHEHSLYDLLLAMNAVPCAPTFVLADVRDAGKLRRIFRHERPTHVFHLAAYKHVPFGQLFPEETVSVNIVATRQLLDLSAETGVSSFVYPSSDKAVNPPSLYGATKRLGEVATRQMADCADGIYNVVRYVNVIGTRGSVIETFSRQLAAREALSVTSADMTRYWMTMNEAVWLLLIAGTRSHSADVLMLEDLHEISVLDMASRLSAMLGFGSAPEIRITGMRPGERLREELLSANETLVPSEVAGIGLVDQSDNTAQLCTEIPSFAQVLDLPPEKLTSRVMALARELQ